VVSFTQVYPTKSLYTPFLSQIRATCPAHLDFITQTILCEEYRSLIINRIHNSTPPVAILSQINPVHASIPLSRIHFNIIFPPTPRSSKWSLFLRSLHIIPVCFVQSFAP
jgi:hypothetical protein